MMPKGCIIFCVEKGILEKYTLLSISSIKKFGGFLSQYDIFCFQPRKEFPVSKKTKNILSKFGVVFIDKALNVKHRYYSMVNKSIVCNYMEKKHKYEKYIYLDSDTIILNEPHLLLSTTCDISLSPVYTKGIGISTRNDKNYEYWQKLFDAAKIEMNNLPTIKTLFENETIIGYWNGAIIAHNRQYNFFWKWNDLVVNLLENTIYPDTGIYFIEQSCLAATILSGNYTLETLPLNYNFPLSDKIFDKINASSFDEIVIMHHLSELHLLKKYESVLCESYKYQWIQEKLKELKIHPSSLNFMLLKAKERLIKGFKERLFYFIYKFTSK